MAMYLRRALLNRGVTLIRSSVVHPRIILEPLSLYGSKSHEVAAIPDINFIRESRRGFAKGRRSRDDSGSTSVDVAPDIGPTVKENAAAQMDAAVVALSRELSKIRTGRASAGMLDHIIVETGGVKMPLNRMALVSVLDSKTLSINPYDPNALKALQKAIVSSPLGLNPKEDGERLVSSIPPLTKEHVQAMCKVVSKSSEDVKQSIRRARQKALDTIKKAGSSLPKDSVKRLEKEIDELTKKFVKSAEDMCKSKEKEITQS
uniref:Ribosome-recycling factor, chloroplastic n=1 Tax=Monsonia marlothii TaxID=163685 RepID=A0A0G4APW6_9ROSI|nr:ribosome recycling factor [Monsonia marlothii]